MSSLCLVAAFVCSCATTKVKQTWKSPDYHGGPVTKVAVLTVTDRPMLRQGFENRLVYQLKQNGVTSVPTYDQLSLSEINKDKKAAAEKVRSNGSDAVLVMRLIDLTSSYREYRPGGERYAETINGWGYDYFYDYYTVAYMDMSPTYGTLKQHVYLESRLFDLKTAKPLWAGITLTVVTETTDRMAEMDPIVAKVVEAMKKDGVIP
jgi:hypothetical protein